jgi:dUTP pyrophosphatase
MKIRIIIKDGERICQMIITKHERAEWMAVDELLITNRGTGGFGHIGK